MVYGKKIRDRSLEAHVNVSVRPVLVCVSAIAVMGLAMGAGAQQRRSSVSSRSSAYDTNREAVVQGTVLSYTENSGRAPVGAHVTVETLAGPVDVHLGPASYLHASNFSLVPGDSVQLVGASISANGVSVFLARIVEKRGQTITIRSPRGFPLASHASRTLSERKRAPAAQQPRPR
jgi:hypothetical protein